MNFDKIASLSTETGHNLLQVLHEYCAKQHSGTVRFAPFQKHCAELGVTLDEEAWYDIIAESKIYTFTEDCDKRGVYWRTKHVVL